MKYRKVKRTEASGDPQRTPDAGGKVERAGQAERRRIYQQTWFQLAIGLAAGALVALLRQR